MILLIGSAIAVVGSLLSRSVLEKIEYVPLSILVMVVTAYLIDRIRSWIWRWGQLKD